MIDTKERSTLRSFANSVSPIVYVGKDGVNEGVIDEVNTCLYNCELIKVSVQRNCPTEVKEVAQQIQEKTDCEVVQCMGRKITLYKRTTKKEFKHFI